MTTPTTAQARCEQIARELLKRIGDMVGKRWFGEWNPKSPLGYTHEAITTSLLAAEERGSAATDDAWLAALAKAGWKDAASWGDGAEDPSEGRQAICCRIRDELDAAEERGRQGKPEPDCHGPDCGMCNGEYCKVHFTGPCDCDVLARHGFDQRTQQSEPARECVEIATRIISETCYEAPELNDPSACIANADRMKQAIAAALQAERTKLASVEESARRVIEQAVQVLATRPITGERHAVLTELETWLNEHPRKETNE